MQQITEKDLSKIAKKISKKVKKGDYIFLEGELGVGKTTLSRFIIDHLHTLNNLSIPRSIKSPTYPILLTYDLNTFEALKQCGLYEVIDGYGIKPYNENGIIFIPQLFYRLLTIPFFHQTTQIHINEWSFNDIDKFEEFIKKNKDKIISYEEMLGKKTNNLIIKLLNKLTKIFLISYRKFF